MRQHERLFPTAIRGGICKSGTGCLEVTPDLFRHKRGKGVQQAQGGIQHAHQGDRRIVRAVSAFSHLQFGNFHIPVGKIVPQEIIDLAASLAVLVRLEEPVNGADKLLQPRPDP